MRKDHLFEVWYSQGNGLHRGPSFKLRHDAVVYVEQHRGEATFAVREPDGKWTTFGERAPASL